mmetsp:Transcript_24314/g.34827  ORF Transcript_24314/g.34827 Transcript_24314/m.34827 type:complete len:97 (+) Transcript_24314:1307-1597(+)
MKWMSKSDGRPVLVFAAIECCSYGSSADGTYEQKNVKCHEMMVKVKVTPFLDAAMPRVSLTSTGNSSETLPSFQFIRFVQRNFHNTYGNRAQTSGL